ncbi:MAG: FKBP-type peptidyl-prolyl cis-trans isomerase [Pseudomonadota bacterium]|nr:FKBP-type peptidyl-prolyl cis-trans isomerase [Pseudomonadota bacterium]
MTDEAIGPGSRVTLHYRVAIEDGFVVEDTFAGEPETIVIGRGDVHECIERTLSGLVAGTREAFVIPPESGFGLRDPEAVHRMPRLDFPADIDLERGQIIEFQTPSGATTPGAVVSIEGEFVEVDFNHPLAGHALHCEVEVLAVTATHVISGQESG